MSPVIHNDRLFSCQDDDLFPALYWIDTGSGEVIWKDDRSDMACNYSHLIVCETDREPEVVVIETNKYRLNDTPIPAAFWTKIERGDENHDGILEGDEIDRAFLDPSNQGGLLASEVQQRLGGRRTFRTWMRNALRPRPRPRFRRFAGEVRETYRRACALEARHQGGRSRGFPAGCCGADVVNQERRDFGLLRDGRRTPDLAPEANRQHVTSSRLACLR